MCTWVLFVSYLYLFDGLYLLKCDKYAKKYTKTKGVNTVHTTVK